MANSEGRYIEVNLAAAKITGYTQEELLGLSIYDLVPEEASAQALNHFNTLIRTGESAGDVPFLRKDGSRGVWNVNAVKIGDDLLLGYVNDVTERQTELEDNRERFLLAMNSISDGLFDWNLVDNSIYYSPAWKQMLGYEDQELPNELGVWEELVDPEDLARAWKMQQELVRGERDLFEIEFHMRHKKGHWVDILSRAKVYFDTEGRALRMIGTHVDISERKRAEKEILEREQRLKSIFRAAPAGIGVVSNRVMIEVNEQMCAMTGYSKEELQGQPALMLYPTREEHDYVGREKYRQIREGGTGSVETRWLRKDGRIIEILLSSTPIDPENWEKGVTFTATDITRQKENAARIAKDLEEKKILLKELYHRTKNNMQVIASFLKLQAMYMDRPEYSAATQEIVDKIVAMSLVHQKLYESKTLSQIQLDEYLRELATHQVASLNSAPIIIDTVFNLTSVFVTIDEAIPIGLVVTELISNSLKHAFPGYSSGRITIELTSETGGGIVLVYRDNGVGIAAGRELRGTDSMGLTTVFSLVESQLNGAISYSSRDGLEWRIHFDVVAGTERGKSRLLS